MQGALYYPYIRVPNDAWWTRTLLYWDSVATITPSEYIHNPDLHDPFTLDLIQADLLYQVSPQEAENHFIENFRQFVSFHGPDEIQRRQNNFQMGTVAHIHIDKYVNERCFGWLERHGLAQQENDRWSLVEESTAAEFMAALALSVCEAADQREWSRRAGLDSERWIPVTNDGPSTRALLSGLKPAADGAETRVGLRIRGEQQLAEICSVVLPQILPVPESPVNVDAIVRFRHRHGDLLPRFRREMEDRFQRLADLDDPARRQREMDRLEDDVHERVAEVSAYLSEARVGRVVKSSLVSLFKLLPVVKDEVAVAQEIYANSQRHADFERDPLAYLAFANAAFAPVQKYTIDPYTGRPLVSAVSDL